MPQDHMPPLFAPRAQKWNIISLLFSLFYFLPVIMSARTLQLLDWVQILTGYGVFLACYYWGLIVDSKKAIYPVGALILCCMVISSFTPGSNALFGFAMFLTAYYFPLKKAITILVITLLLECLAFLLFRQYDLMFLGIALFLSVALFVNAVFLRQDLQHRLTETRDQEQIEQLATIAERERIGRDLHDLLGHTLSSIALKAELAEKLISAGKSDDAIREISEVAQLSRNALTEVRESVSGLKKTGLKAEFSIMCDRLSSANFDADCDYDLPDTFTLSPDTESTFILLLKEASTNILRHSQGNKARLAVSYQEPKLCLSIWDNGHSQPLTAGNGIAGMRERCTQINADFELKTGADGTLLSVSKDLNNDNRGRL